MITDQEDLLATVALGAGHGALRAFGPPTSPSNSTASTLDAAYSRRDGVDDVLDTFPVVNRTGGQRDGEYRPKQLILDLYTGVRSPRPGREPKTWTVIDRDYEQIRIDMQTLFNHLGIITTAPAA